MIYLENGKAPRFVVERHPMDPALRFTTPPDFPVGATQEEVQEEQVAVLVPDTGAAEDVPAEEDPVVLLFMMLCNWDGVSADNADLLIVAPPTQTVLQHPP
jgi:hypothetical protein